jgi:hypothetical protein
MSTRAGTPYTGYAVSRPLTFSPISQYCPAPRMVKKARTPTDLGDEKRLSSRIKMMLFTRKRLRGLSALSGDIRKDLAYCCEQF